MKPIIAWAIVHRFDHTIPRVAFSQEFGIYSSRESARRKCGSVYKVVKVKITEEGK